MNTATVEVPAQDAEWFLTTMTESARNSAERYALSTDDESAEDLGWLKRARRESEPLIEQGKATTGPATYTGSAMVLAETADNVMRDHVERLHEAASVSPLQTDEIRAALRSIEWWLGECERLEAIDRSSEGEAV